MHASRTAPHTDTRLLINPCRRRNIRSCTWSDPAARQLIEVLVHPVSALPEFGYLVATAHRTP
ncbi:hypothetical protein Q3A86_36245 [Streptomyces sp. NBUA17]|uniref:hypothetical protein n=1 Tax=Streptomyces sp. NBUA17 TaxID=3062275 RepID=UPI0037D9A4D7